MSIISKIRDAVKGNFKRRVHIVPATHKRLFCMISVMTRSPRSAGSESNTVRELQRAALNDLMTVLLRKFSAAQACTDWQLAVQTDGCVATESVIGVINCCFVVMTRRKVVSLCVLSFVTSAACLTQSSVQHAHRVCASMMYNKYQFSADSMVRSGSYQHPL